MDGRADSMILEGIVTTIDADDASRSVVNISPMGPIVNRDMKRMTLRPYTSSRTYRNLKAHGEGVFHVTDDAELLARAAVSRVDAPTVPAAIVRGFRLEDACRAYEFRVVKLDDACERTTIEVEIVHTERVRDFFGFHRARHAVLEAAILATRTAFLPVEEILRQLEDLHTLVEKTGSEREHRAFAFLREFVESKRDSTDERRAT